MKYNHLMQKVLLINDSMVETYWNIGKKIYEECGENDRAEYGKNYWIIYLVI